MEPLEPIALRELPYERVLAASAADDENLQTSVPSRLSRMTRPRRRLLDVE
jgi:hypothetical protein